MPKFIDLSGNKYGYLTVICRDGYVGKRIRYKCQCECGNFTFVSTNNLTTGSIKSCGCKQFSVLADKFTKNEVGNRFGRLVAIEMIKRPKIINGRKNGNSTYFRCICDCGKETIVWGAHLRNGSTISCGCYSADSASKRFRTHGLSDTKEYIAAKTRKRKERMRNLDIEWDTEKEIFIRNLFQECVVCGMTNEENLQITGKSLQVDHVKPLSKGNGLSVGNATVLCYRCNNIKQAKELEDLPERMRNRIQLTADLFKLLWEGQ